MIQNYNIFALFWFLYNYCSYFVGLFLEPTCFIYSQILLLCMFALEAIQRYHYFLGWQIQCLILMIKRGDTAYTNKEKIMYEFKLLGILLCIFLSNSFKIELWQCFCQFISECYLFLGSGFDLVEESGGEW